MSTTSNRIVSLYKSRSNILEHLEYLDYDTSDYLGFSINEIDAMCTNNQLDMLVTNKMGRKAYVKYYLTAKQIRNQMLDEIIEDLYTIDSVLTKDDTLIIIIDDEPNDTIITKLKYIYEQDGIFVVIHNIKRLLFNILKHKLVPKCSILTDVEVKDLFQKYNIKDLKQLPEISRFDPQALVICLRPGQVCKFERDSQTALKYDYYRVCV
uniref:RNA polymerase subunit H/Rpb5 C-terminal domain-containing protein n=1 Tax=viral metagenome TaxID=1070528 RepID=A0A6C0DS95_9ZZZZ